MAHYAALEINEGKANDPDSIINAFCKRIEAFCRLEATLWRECAARRFDIGVLSGTTRGRRNANGLRLDLQPATLKRVAALSAQIVFTIYPKAFRPIQKRNASPRKLARVGLIMGSASDWKTMSAAAALLEEFGVAFEKNIVSAHRTPHWLAEYAAAAQGAGCR